MTAPGDLHELVRATTNYLRAYEPVKESLGVFDTSGGVTWLPRLV